MVVKERKNSIVAMLVSLLVTGLIVVGTPSTVMAADHEVKVPDPHLRKILESSVGHPAPITKVDLKAITSLHIRSGNITDLTGLEYAVNLENLDAGYNKIASLAPLKGLEKLVELDVDENPITNYEGLSTLKNLKQLFISGTGFKDLSILKSLPAIEYVTLAGNGLSDSDITPLKDVKTLKIIDLSNNKLRNIEFIRSLPALIGLDLAGNHLPDIRSNSVGGTSGGQTIYIEVPGGTALDKVTLPKIMSGSIDTPNVWDLKENTAEPSVYVEFSDDDSVAEITPKNQPSGLNPKNKPLLIGTWGVKSALGPLESFSGEVYVTFVDKADPQSQPGVDGDSGASSDGGPGASSDGGPGASSDGGPGASSDGDPGASEKPKDTDKKDTGASVDKTVKKTDKKDSASKQTPAVKQTSGKHVLAKTGAETTALSVSASMLLLIGGGLLTLRRRQS